MSRLNVLIALCCTVLCGKVLQAQQRLMGIEEMFRLADETSSSIKAYRTGMDVSEETLQAAKAQRLPDIGASVSVSFLGDGRLWDRNFENGMRIDIPHFGNNFAIEASQVVYAGGSIDSGVRLAELGRQMAELDWQKNRQEIRFLLAGNYLDLYKLDNQMKVLRKNIDLTDQVIENMKAKREQGTVLRNDITRYELQKETLKLQLTRLRDGRSILNHQIVTTLHLPDSTVIVPDSTLLDRELDVLVEKDWQERAENSSVALRQSGLDIRMQEQQVRMERSAVLPQIAVVAADHLDGPVTIEVPVLNNNFNYWYVGLGVKYNLSSLYKSRHRIRQAKLGVRRAEEAYSNVREQVENAVQAGYVNYKTSFSDLRTQEKTVELADENYRVISNRYVNDLALLTDMLDASNVKLSADLDLVNARINVVYNYYKMKYLTGTL